MRKSGDDVRNKLILARFWNHGTGIATIMLSLLLSF